MHSPWILAGLLGLAAAGGLSAQDAAPPQPVPAPQTPPPSAVTPVAPGAQATPAPAAGSGAAGAKTVKAVPGRFSVQVPAGLFQFAPVTPDTNKLTGLHIKATTNGVVISVIASKSAAADLDGGIEKAVAAAIDRPKLQTTAHEEWTYAGHKAYKYVFQTTVKDTPAVYFSYILRDDERVYIFTASVYTAHRAAFEPVFDEIAKSIAKDASKPDAKSGETHP